MRAYVLGYSSATYVRLRQRENATHTPAANLVRLWAAVVLLALLEALLFQLLHDRAPNDLARGPAAAVYVAANVFVFFAALLVLAHVAGRTCVDYAPPTPPAAPNTRAELKHLFVHLLLLAYLRTTCWFEGRAAVRWLARA